MLSGIVPNTRHPRDNQMGHVSVSCDNLEPFNRLGISYNIIENNWAVFFDPGASSEVVRGCVGMTEGARQTMVARMRGRIRRY